MSHQGMLVSDNTLVLQLRNENQMNGTDFLVFLQRKNHEFDFPAPKSVAEMMVSQVKSCH
jgi:hypothetical protein